MVELPNRYLRLQWLVDILKRSNGLSYEEIDAFWRESSLNNKSNIPLPLRTFHRHKKEIEKLFGIVIEYKRSQNKYILKSLEKVESESFQKWLISTFTVGNILNDARDLQDRIQLEEVQIDDKRISTIISAMREGFVLKMVYFNQETDKNSKILLRPYFMKLFGHRWYVIGVSGNNQDEIHTYAFDNIVSLRPTAEKFKYPGDFSPIDFFKDSFGIYRGKGPVQNVVLRVPEEKETFFDLFPLHHSQKKLDDIISSGVYYQYRLSLTYDFVQAICSRGSSVEVIQPDNLRLWVIDEVKKMYKVYKEDIDYER